MPKVKLVPIIEEIHGTMYDMVFKKSSPDKMIATKVKWSKARKPNLTMSQAVAAVQVALLDPKVKAKYERKAKKLGHPWNLALSDALNGKDLRTSH